MRKPDEKRPKFADMSSFLITRCFGPFVHENIHAVISINFSVFFFVLMCYFLFI
jgi:hypothetical protein